MQPKLYSKLGLTAWLTISALIWVSGCSRQPEPQTPAIPTRQLIEVGESSQVSSARPGAPHWEVIDGADSKNSNNLVGCSWVGNNIFIGQAVSYSSSDGGKNWMPGVKTPVGWGDPDCRFAPDGTAFFVVAPEGMYPESLKRSQFRLAFWRSADGGKKWAGPAFIASGWDRPWLAFDNGLHSKFRGRMYVSFISHWPLYNRIVFSQDGGKTFSEPRGIPFELVGGEANGPPVVSPDGTLILVFLSFSPHPSPSFVDRHTRVPHDSLSVVRSTDGGLTFSRPVRISLVDSYGGVPPLAVDMTQGPYHGRVYATWSDAQSGRARIMIAYSDDSGQTWSLPRIASDDPDNFDFADARDSMMPSIAVNKRGVVGLSWYDRRDHPDDVGFSVRFSASADGGQTFFPSVAIPDARSSVLAGEREFLTPIALDHKAANNPESLIELNFWIGGKFPMYGDTAGMAADAGGVFHPMWIDNRTGVPQVWSAAVTVNTASFANWDRRLARLRDVTRDVALEVGDPVFDTKRSLVAMRVQIVNRSHKKLPLPMFLQLSTADSDIARVQAANPSNRQEHTGAAAWEFAAAGKSLLPGERTGWQELQFRMTDLQPMYRNGEFFWNILHAGVRVFGGG